MQKKVIKPFFLIIPAYIYVNSRRKIIRPHAQYNPHTYQTNYMGMND